MSFLVDIATVLHVIAKTVLSLIQRSRNREMYILLICSTILCHWSLVENGWILLMLTSLPWTSLWLSEHFFRSSDHCCRSSSSLGFFMPQQQLFLRNITFLPDGLLPVYCFSWTSCIYQEFLLNFNPPAVVRCDIIIFVPCSNGTSICSPQVSVY